MDFLFLLTLLTYLAASILHALSLNTGINRISQAAFWSTTTGFALHTMSIVLRWVSQGQFPMARWLDSISFLAWAIILIYLVIAYLTRLRAPGRFRCSSRLRRYPDCFGTSARCSGLADILAELLAARPYHTDFPFLRRGLSRHSVLASCI